jgi:hypothetical protein
VVLEKLRKTMKNGNTSKNKLIKPNSKHLMTGTAIFIAAILVISGTNIKGVFADNVNTVQVTLSMGSTSLKNGETVTATYQVVATSGSGDQSGCNTSDGTPLILNLAASTGLTPSTQSVTFTGCGPDNRKSVTFTSNYEGNTPTSAGVTFNGFQDTGTGDIYNFNVNFGVQLEAFTPPPPSDTTPPVLTVPPNQIVEATGPGGAAVTFSATANDETDGPLNPTCTPPSGSTFALGETIVKCEAKDAAGNTGSASFTVTVQDTTGPVFSNVPSGVTAEATGPTGAVVAYTTPTATDAVDGDRPVSCDPASGSTFPLATTTVTCSASDTRNNPNTATFNVIVQDTTAPTLNIPSGINAIATSISGAVVTFTKSAEDLVSGSVAVTCTPKDSGDTFPLKTTTVQCSAKDAAGNTASGSFVVTVKFPDWSGILQPINKEGDSVFKLGSTIPVKFQIPTPSGGFVTDAIAKLLVTKIANNVLGDEAEATTTTPASSGNDFRYDSTSNQYIYNLGTKSGYTAGTYQLRIDIGDLSTNTVQISLRK